MQRVIKCLLLLVFVSLFLLFVGYYFFIIPKLNTINQLSHQKILLTNQWQKNQTNHSLPVTIKPTEFFSLNLENLILFAHLNRLKVRSIKTYENLSVDGRAGSAEQVVLLGDFNNMQAFILALTQQSSLMPILEFSYQAGNEDDLLTLKIFHFQNLQQDVLPPPISTTSLMKDPFCHLFESNNSTSHANIAPVAHMKMVGYLYKEKTWSGLILLPNNELIAVSTGMIIGKERGIVSQITANYIAVKLANESLFFIRM